MWDFAVLKVILMPRTILWFCSVQYLHELPRNCRCADDGLDRLLLDFDFESEIYENRVGQCRTDVARHFWAIHERMQVDNTQLRREAPLYPERRVTPTQRIKPPKNPERVHVGCLRNSSFSRHLFFLAP
jgi:hypothetical protein